MIHFSRDKDDNWEIVGEDGEIEVDTIVEVETKDGKKKQVLVTRKSSPFTSKDDPNVQLVFASFENVCTWKSDEEAGWLVAGHLEELRSGNPVVVKKDGTWERVKVIKTSIEQISQNYGTAKPQESTK